MLDIDGGEFQIVELELMDEPFQGERVPHNLTARVEMCLLDGLLHVIVWDGIFTPALADHQMVAETAIVYDNAKIGQIFHLVDDRSDTFLVYNTMGEQLEHGFAVHGIVVVEVGIHAAHQVSLSCLQVVECLAGGFQFDDIGDVKFLEDEFEQVDVVAYGLAILIQEGIGPEVPCVFIHEGIVFGEDSCTVTLLCGSCSE